MNGWKDVENRSRQFHYRGRILIHAPIRPDAGAIKAWPWPDIERPAAFLTGGIVGEAELVDCVMALDSPWFEGPFGLVLVHARPRRFRPCKGHQGGLFVPRFA